MADQTTETSSNDSVNRAQEVINDGFSVRNENNGRIRAIQKLFEEAFIIAEPKGPRKLNAQRIYQALWRTVGRSKMLDFMIHGTTKDGDPIDPNMERLVTDGVSTTMSNGGFNSAFRDKQGLAFNMYLYGDGFLHVGPSADDNKEQPIEFRVLSNDNIYVDNFATGVRATASGSSATKMIVIFSYSKDEFDSIWPGNDEIVGTVQRNRDEKELIKDINQDLGRERKRVEVAYSYDLTEEADGPVYVVFAGNQMKVLVEEKGEDYPFVKDDEPYIPISQFMCMPSSEGFYNEGIGSMIYKLAIIQRELLNMEVNHIQDNTYPIVHTNIPKGQVSSYYNKLKAAHEMVASGRKGFVAMEYDPNNPGSDRVTSEALLTNNLFNEWQAIFDRLDQELRRLGINIDEVESGGDKTATEILALEESSNAFVKQVMEFNASETQFLVELTMDMITEFIPKSNKTPLNLRTKLRLPSGKEVQTPQVTLGNVSEEIKKNHYFVDVNSRSGSIPSNTLKRAQINSILPFAQPGSPAWTRAVGNLSELSGFEATGEEFLIQAQETEPAAAAGESEVAAAPASETDRLTINPRVAEQAAVI